MKKSFELQFDTYTKAFEDNPKQEMARIMQKVIKQYGEGMSCGFIRDANANQIGGWKVIEVPPSA